MGIDFTWKGMDAQNTASWSYSGFNSFRRRLAEETGFTLEQYFESNVVDDIEPLLNHSDCDGEISPEDCAKVAPRLKELMEDWPDDYDKQMGTLLARNMEECALEKTPLIFT